MADLVVELYGTRLGTLRGDWRDFDLIPDSAALHSFGIDSPILSVAIPLAPKPASAHRKRRQNFFRELLPEGRMLQRLAYEAGVPEDDTIGLLRTYGRDVAGALQIWDPEIPGEPRTPRLERLDTARIAALLEDMRQFPLGNKPGSGKSSLAGVQDKVVLAHKADGWNLVLDGYPSTHILKPVPADLPTVIFDEEYGARLVRALGLATHETRLEEFAGVPALVIERYDRLPEAPQGRLHQEDFNQALGAGGAEKYQRYGGKVSLGRVAQMLRQSSDEDDLNRLLQMVVLAVAAGNLDMHTKNISLLHPEDGSVRLAPAYDFVPQAHQENEGELALAIAGEYRHAAVTRHHIVEEARAWGLAGPEQLIAETLENILSTVSTEVPHPRAHPLLAEDITRFTRNLLDGKAAGTAD